MSAEDIGYRAESTANWWRSKAAQFPQDTRNLQAAEELERLASQIEALEGSEVYRQVDDAEESLVAAAGASGREDVWTDFDEMWPPNFARSDFTAIMTGLNFLSGVGTCCGRRSRACPFPKPTSTEEAVNGSSVKRSSWSEVPRKPIPMSKRGPAERDGARARTLFWRMRGNCMRSWADD